MTYDAFPVTQGRVQTKIAVVLVGKVTAAETNMSKITARRPVGPAEKVGN